MTTPKGYLFRAIIILAAAPSQRSGWPPKSEWLKRDAIDEQSGDQKLFIAVEVVDRFAIFGVTMKKLSSGAICHSELEHRISTPRVSLSLNGTAFGATGANLLAVARVEIESNWRRGEASVVQCGDDNWG
ncbi:hypothetical protein [Bradyrhizobium sp. RDM4]|uniref:hypothetical protein n=1 Tax=Bradyrhizobium sp. RDM4 TaxID=3378765 RepID=UPI0038FCACF8